MRRGRKAKRGGKGRNGKGVRQGATHGVTPGRLRLPRFAAAALLLLVLALNPWSLWFVNDHWLHLPLNSIFTFTVVSGDLALLALAAWCWLRPAQVVQLFPSLMVSAASVLVTLVILEFALRAAAPPQSFEGVRSTEYHHLYAPNTSGTRYAGPNDEFSDVRLTINSLAMRGPELGAKTRPRILILGDSFIQADELPLNATVGPLLGQQLPACEVLQQGYSSWSPLLELNYLVRHEEELQPDHIALVLVINDFYDCCSDADPAYTLETVFDEDGLPVQFRIPNPSVTRGVTSSRLVKLLLRLFTMHKGCPRLLTQEEIDAYIQGTADESVVAIIKERPQLENQLRLARRDWDAATRAAVDLTLSHVRRLQSFAAAHGADLVTMLTPLGWNVAPEETVLGKQSAHYCLAPDVVISDEPLREYLRQSCPSYKEILPSFREAGGPLFFRADGHWNERGHALMARLLAQEFSSRCAADTKV